MRGSLWGGGEREVSGDGKRLFLGVDGGHVFIIALLTGTNIFYTYLYIVYTL